ncbi:MULTISPECIES: hypothetical protein [Acinetobacter]|jgi:hypothetical protein|nr:MULTISPECIES: hypothetical protein [Acinetobacter calcoaceticus/baumannii complex]EXG37278.1 hypothetical protein J717_0036 [Acinetobacter baumannii 121738]KJX73441.1 hypothetical protein WH42_04775 [Acinetobacter baumannii]KQE28993.1 hypothetical protein APD42_14900 [Acinetobacter nosocomialis]MBJ9442968.1 hypothetical protein [Acinetobacter baumannii]MBK5978474.1 hypothetical protein [Acinetobacter baumannii]
MTTSNVQTKPKHTELTQVRWTKAQLKVLKKIAYEKDTKVAIYIRNFMVNHHPELQEPRKDEQL